MRTNHPLHARQAANVLAITLLTVLTVAQSQVCVGQELPLPSQPAPAAAEQLPQGESTQLNGPSVPPECKGAPVDEPLFTLTTDIRPRLQDREDAKPGDLPFNTGEQPYNCASLKPVPKVSLNLDASCETCYPGYCNLLRLARFCHKPLYFNDDCLERCGVEQCCCQPCRSALCFYGGALLMPARVCCVCPCKCVPSGGCCE